MSTITQAVARLRINIYTNGHLCDWENYFSGQEEAALETSIGGLWNTEYTSQDFYEVRDGYLYCTREDEDRPFPLARLNKVIKCDDGQKLRLVGDLIPIKPPQYGVSPWEADVKIQFELCD